MCDFASLFEDADKMKEITKEAVEQARAKKPKRICFATAHDAQPKRVNKVGYVGSFNVPFGEGFHNIFPLVLFPNKNDSHHVDSYWRSISSEEEFEKIRSWVNEQGKRVFLRDCLYTSIALSHNFVDKENRTEIGELEYLAKQKKDPDAVEKLAKCCAKSIKDIPIYDKADMICAIPPNPGKCFDLPSQIAVKVSEMVDKENITDKFVFGAKKGDVKSESVDEKWNAWSDAALEFSDDLTDKKIILIDDKYQSGTTIQFVAMKLQEAGAHHVLGLCIVKTMSDTDNQ